METQKDTEVTEVVFRKWNSGNKEVFALFPYDVQNLKGDCGSYQHIGQHSGANYKHCISRSKPATPKEYADLKKELKGIGYNLEVIKKINYQTYLNVKWALILINN